MKIYIDAMGGDHAPKETVKGAVEAVKEYNIPLILVGKEEIIKKELENYSFDSEDITILNADSVIGFDEEPVKALRHKKDSSLVVALRAMKNDEDSCLVSAGSTGALLAGGTLILGRIPGVKRPGLGVNFPREKKPIFTIDIGASADAQPEYLLTYAKLATIYLETVEGVKNPSIGLLNIGEEEEKGSTLIKQAHELLKQSDLNFKGNIEPTKIFTSPVDILITDGFTGNILSKTVEGVSKFLFDSIKKALMTSLSSKIGAVLIKKDLKALKKRYNSDEIGGSPLLGVKGGIIKAHGSSDAHAFKNAIYQGIQLTENHTVEKITEIMKG